MNNEQPSIAVVGAGYWGSNLVRNFHKLGVLNTVSDRDPDVRQDIQSRYPDVDVTEHLEDVLTDPNIAGVALVTPAKTHYELGREILKAGKHLYVEKPLSFRTNHVRKLIDLASEQGVQLMTGHIMVYHPVIQKLRNLIRNGELGNIRYAYSTRVNLGQVRPDANVLWNLAIHDIAVFLKLFNGQPESVSSTGEDFIQNEIADVAFLTIHFDSGQLAHVHASWLDPQKIRKLTVVGEDKMAVFEDTKISDKLAIHNKWAQKNDHRQNQNYPAFVQTKSGDTVLPNVQMEEPLLVECREFINSIREDAPPETDGEHGLEVIKVLEAADRSLEQNGERVSIKSQ